MYIPVAYHTKLETKYLRFFFGFGINKYQFAKVKRTSVLFSPNIEVFVFFHLTGFLPMIKKVDAYLPIFIRVLYIKHTIWLLKYILYI